VVATDDERIAEVCRAAGAQVVMTSDSCPNGEHLHASAATPHWLAPGKVSAHPSAGAAPAGTERCHEAVSKLGQEYDIVVNIQGDEPLLEPEIIDQVVAALQATPDAVYRFMCWALLPACSYESMHQCMRLLRLATL
jgi:3-deoxy-manno-octulosonate cytidylyltransferase (CMP-KDO synthetase)